MSKPRICDFMTKVQRTIGRAEPLVGVQRVMREYNLRHLPVLDGTELVGLLAQRDVYFVDALGLTDLGRLRVEDVMSPVPYVVAPDATLDEVVRAMAEYRLSSAVVMEAGVVVGLFTSAEALATLATLLHAPAAASSAPEAAAARTDD